MKSKHSSGLSRLQQKCNRDFETLKINDSLVDRIKGKVICIIDDYITNGYSAEAAKHLLLSAGAKKVIFLSIGKLIAPEDIMETFIKKIKDSPSPAGRVTYVDIQEDPLLEETEQFKVIQ